MSTINIGFTAFDSNSPYDALVPVHDQVPALYVNEVIDIGCDSHSISRAQASILRTLFYKHVKSLEAEIASLQSVGILPTIRPAGISGPLESGSQHE